VVCCFWVLGFGVLGVFGARGGGADQILLGGAGSFYGVPVIPRDHYLNFRG